MQTLFGEERGSSVLDIAFEGPSFSRAIEISALGHEILALDNCIRTIARKLKEHRQISVEPTAITLHVEPFQEGSFKKKVRLGLVGTIEANPTTSIILATIFTGVLSPLVNWIVTRPESIQTMSPEFMVEVADQVQIELLTDPLFLKNLADIVRPLSSSEDSLIIRNREEEIEINYEQKACFIDAAAPEVLDIPITTSVETLTGRIVMIDLDATKNQIGFKVDGKGSEVTCALNVGDISDIKNLLGEWVELSGSVDKKGDIYVHIEVDAYHQVDPPPDYTQAEMQM